MRNPMILLCALCALLALPALASAQGNAAQDEYTENVPGGAGDRPSDEGGGGSLPPGTAQDLQALGADGAAAAALAAATGPDRREDGRGQRSGQGQGSDARLDADGGSGGGVGEIVNDIVVGSPDDDGGMGFLLPLILGASLVAAIGFLLARRGGGGAAAGPA